MINIENFPNGIQVLQNDEYKFTKDSIDLAKFCVVKNSDNVLELCAGSGAISFYVYALNKFNKLYLNELQPNFCEILDKNIVLNNLQENANILRGDLKNLKAKDFDKKFDVIICNPPYYKVEKDVQISDKSKALCKHEITITLKDVIKKATELIKDKGKFYICMIANRSAELLGELYLHNFHAKRIKYLSNGKDGVYTILVEAVFNGKIGAKVIV